MTASIQKFPVARSGYYAVIRVDAESMVQALPFEDQQMQREVQEMKRQKYLIYFERVSSLAHPDVLQDDVSHTHPPACWAPLTSLRLDRLQHLYG